MNKATRILAGIIALVVLAGGGVGFWWFFSRPQPLNLTLTNVIAVGDEPIRLAASSDSSKIYVSNAASATLSVIDARTHEVVEELAVAENARLFGVALSPDDRTAYISYTERTADTNGFVAVVNLNPLEVAATIPVRQIPQDLVISQDGRRLYVANGGSDSISVIDTETLGVLKQIPVGVHPYSLVVVPDQPRAYVTHTQGARIEVLDLAQNTVAEQIGLPVDGRFLGIDISRDGGRLFVANGVQNAIHAIKAGATDEFTSLQVARDIEAGTEYSPMELKVSPDGTRLYVVNRNGYLSVFSLPDYQLLGTLEVGKDLRDIAFTEDGAAYIASFGTNSVVVVGPEE